MKYSYVKWTVTRTVADSPASNVDIFSFSNFRVSYYSVIRGVDQIVNETVTSACLG